MNIFLIVYIVIMLSAMLHILTDYDMDWQDRIIRTGICILGLIIVMALNFFCFPNKENRYVVTTEFAASLDGDTMATTLDLPVDETIYVQVRIAVKSNSYTRRFLNDNKIPVTVTISDQDVAQYTVQLSRNFEEITLPETNNNLTNYFFHVYADKKAETAIIAFKGRAVKEGTQQVRVRYGNKVSGKYERVYTLNYY